VPSPNDVRREEGWPASTDPTAGSIAPPNTSSGAAAPVEPMTPPVPPVDGGGKIANLLDRHRSRHAADD
jgi:hypothetical protein